MYLIIVFSAITNMLQVLMFTYVTFDVVNEMRMLSVKLDVDIHVNVESASHWSPCIVFCPCLKGIWSVAVCCSVMFVSLKQKEYMSFYDFDPVTSDDPSRAIVFTNTSFYFALLLFSFFGVGQVGWVLWLKKTATTTNLRISHRLLNNENVYSCYRLYLEEEISLLFTLFINNPKIKSWETILL